MGEDAVQAVPHSNLSCATAWAQRASRFPPLGGDERPGRTAVDHNEGGSFEEIALDAPEQCIEQDRLLAIALKHQASSVHGPIEG
jgi:hypothetical protein